MPQYLDYWLSNPTLRYYVSYLAVVRINSIMLNLIVICLSTDDQTKKILNHIKKICSRKHMIEQKLVEAVSKLYYSEHSLLHKNIIRYITFLTNGPIKYKSLLSVYKLGLRYQVFRKNFIKLTLTTFNRPFGSLFEHG